VRTFLFLIMEPYDVIVNQPVVIDNVSVRCLIFFYVHTERKRYDASNFTEQCRSPNIDRNIVIVAQEDTNAFLRLLLHCCFLT